MIDYSNKQVYDSHPVSYKDLLSDKYNKIHYQLYQSALLSAYNSFIDYIKFTKEDDNGWVVYPHIKDHNFYSVANNSIRQRLLPIKYVANYNPITGLIFPDFDLFKKNVTIIEIPNDEYWKPSSVVWKLKHYPFSIISPKFNKNTKVIANIWTKNPSGELSLQYWWNNYTYLDKIDTKKYNKYAITYLDYINGKATLRNKMDDSIIYIDFDQIHEYMEIDDTFSLTNTYGYKIYNK